ncbi:MAG: hypothetical protein KGL63_02850 [Betaproteobacteria bacterium]|nr:hypothetical protein [Betaproteobacteria bacterium]
MTVSNSPARASPHCSHVRTQAGLRGWRAGINDPGVAQHEDGCFMDSRGLRGALLRGHCVMLRMSIASVASARHVRGVTPWRGSWKDATCCSLEVDTLKVHKVAHGFLLLIPSMTQHADRLITSH